MVFVALFPELMRRSFVLGCWSQLSGGDVSFLPLFVWVMALMTCGASAVVCQLLISASDSLVDSQKWQDCSFQERSRFWMNWWWYLGHSSSISRFATWEVALDPDFHNCFSEGCYWTEIKGSCVKDWTMAKYCHVSFFLISSVQLHLICVTVFWKVVFHKAKKTKTSWTYVDEYTRGIIQTSHSFLNRKA